MSTPSVSTGPIPHTRTDRNTPSTGAACAWSTTATLASRSRAVSTTKVSWFLGRIGAQVDAQHQDAVFEIRGRIPNHGEILEVHLGLCDEHLALVPRHGWKRASLDGGCALLEARDHLCGIEGGHTPKLVERYLRSGSMGDRRGRSSLCGAGLRRTGARRTSGRTGRRRSAFG